MIILSDRQPALGAGRPAVYARIWSALLIPIETDSALDLVLSTVLDHKRRVLTSDPQRVFTSM